LKRPTGAGSLTLYKSEIDSIAFDSLRFALRVRSGNWQIDKPSYLQFRDSSRFEFEGSLSREKDIDIRFQKRSHNPFLIAADFEKTDVRIPWLHNKKLHIALG